MSFYDEYELLELFCSEPKVIDQEVGIYEYQMSSETGHTFTLYFSIHEETVIITLSHNKLMNPIFDISLKEVEKIKADSEKLVFTRNDKPTVMMYVKPSFTLEIENL
ncbi:hypothetical protein [Paludifilum halophilum]|uniref:Uncharacterized protein n=1 Tax=Paludifilum halophilum TaxID=1642702 RepID=A0A235B522_9BACL|nr:hypothetical protein [Paludifilum halophilum]OYD07408.1 hypothetical protein CHM34_10890 [Paludifilum halophilum]